MKQHSVFLKTVVCLTLVLLLGASSVAYARSLLLPPSLSNGALDIGQVGHTGAFVTNGDTTRIWGSGSDIWGRSDQFHYVWHDLPGDGQMVVQVLSQDATDNWAKAGIMLRETVDGNATNVFLALTPRNGVTFQWRAATNAETSNRPGPQMMAPTWLKLVRQHNTITGFASTDGATWNAVSSVTLTLGATSSIGLAVTAHNNTARSRAVFTHVKLTFSVGPPALTATRVYGQGGSFTTKTANNSGISATSIASPEGVALDSSGNFYVSDSANNRVLYYPAGSTTATRVYGQGNNFTTNTTNSGGISATSLSHPSGLTLDSSGNLYVADSFNSRVLYYPAGSTTATRVYGQGNNFTTNTPDGSGINATSLVYPVGVILDSSNNLYVSDSGNNRVLYYPAGSTTATRVYGQGGDFTTNTSNNGGVSATSLAVPFGLALDSSGNLYVSDVGNSRVLYYPTGSTTATRVYGQGNNFITNTSNSGGVSATSLSTPYELALDSTDNLYVADNNNNRVLYYPAGSTTATQVYGQGGSFTTNTAGVSATSFSNPFGLTLDSSNNLYVADSANSRVLMFPQT